MRMNRVLAAGLLTCAAFGPAPAAPQPGLSLTLTTTDAVPPASDTIVAPNVWLHVASGQTPSPFLAPGPFTAAWRGFVTVDLRSVYTFQAEVNGSLKVVINAREALEVAGAGGLSDSGPPVRLNKGANEIIVNYVPAESGDAHVRLFWTQRNSFPQLISQSALSHEPDEAALKSGRRHRGRELFIEHRCARCHTPEPGTVPEALMNAPEFTGIGSRRNAAWIRQWLANPSAARSHARMPVMFHAGDAIDSAEAVAAFLATLHDPAWSGRPEPADPDAVAAGERLFGALHCAACHPPPGSGEGAANKTPLDHVAAKFSPGALVRFLQVPTEHYGSIRMPDFRLSTSEAGRISAYLLAHARPERGEAPRPELMPKGRELVQTTGCLNCHALELDNQFQPRALANLKSWDIGCLAPGPLTGTRVPHFAFSDADRRAIREFAEGGFDSLKRHVDSEFAARQVKNLNCAGCHDRQIAQVPALDVLGGKIRPEYGARFIAGLVPEKPRPWIEARMPGFLTRADGLARGLANLHGFPATTPPAAEAIDEELAEIGFKLVQPNGGFSCVTCHAIGKSAAPQISESQGVNLAWTTDRLQHDYFVRWMRNPLAVDPTTKMPVFFDETGRSPLNRVLGGSTEEQIHAMWEYFRYGARMKVPPGLNGAERPK